MSTDFEIWYARMQAVLKQAPERTRYTCALAARVR